MDFSTVFDIVLSNEKINGKESSKTAKIIQGRGLRDKLNPHSSFTIVRLEISVNISGQKSIGIQLTNSEFQWFVNAIKTKNEQSIHVGKKIFVFNSIGDSSYALAAIENEKIFGVLFNQNDIENFLQNEKVFEFILKNQNANGNVLKDITIDFFTSTIGTDIQEKIKRKCAACKTGKGNHLICTKYFKDLVNKYELLENVLNDLEFQSLIIERFNILMNILNISTAERLLQTQIIIPEIKNDKELLIRKLCGFLDFKEGMSNTISQVMALYLNDESETNLETNSGVED